MKPRYHCLTCAVLLHEHETTVQRVSERYEYWGERGSYVTCTRTCGMCGQEVDERVACARCKERLPVDGTDHCAGCLAAIERGETDELKRLVLDTEIKPFHRIVSRDALSGCAPMPSDFMRPEEAL